MNYATPITSAAEAEGFLFQLYQLGLSFHPEDDAHDVVNAQGRIFTPVQADLINQRMEEVHAFMADPCGYVLNLTTSTDRS